MKKFNEFKTWLSKTIPLSPPDKQKHFNLSFGLVTGDVWNDNGTLKII